jgi:hypothetical protein
MDSPADLRQQLLAILTEHQEGQAGTGRLMLLIASTNSDSFFTAPFNKRVNSKFKGVGGLAMATVVGYRAMRMLHGTANQLYRETVINRMVLLYMIMMISRWADLMTSRFMYVDPNPAGSMATTTIVNALGLGVIDLTAGEVQALTRNFESYETMAKGNEPFNPEWWILQQTLEFIFRMSEA